MKKKLISSILIFSLFFNLVSPVFAEDTTPLPYDDKEFPQTLKDLRRFEIITLGALPFVTLDTTIVYSGIKWAKNDFSQAYKPNIFDKSAYTQDEQKGIILTSVGICIGIGLTDLIVQIVKRNSKKKKERQITYDDISIIPLSEDPEASQIPLPQTSSENQSEIEDFDDIQDADEVQEIEE